METPDTFETFNTNPLIDNNTVMARLGIWAGKVICFINRASFDLETMARKVKKRDEDLRKKSEKWNASRRLLTALERGRF